MQEVTLNNKSFDFLSFSVFALLAPPILWWAMLVLSLTVWKSIGEVLGGNIFEIAVLVACPLLAAILSFATARRTNTKLYWITGAVGIFFAAAAVLASFRSS